MTPGYKYSSTNDVLGDLAHLATVKANLLQHFSVTFNKFAKRTQTNQEFRVHSHRSELERNPATAAHSRREKKKIQKKQLATGRVRPAAQHQEEVSKSPRKELQQAGSSHITASDSMAAGPGRPPRSVTVRRLILRRVV